VLVAGLAALVIVRLRRAPKPGPNAIVAGTVLVVYFLLVGIALNQFRNTFDTRLVYLGSVLVLLAVAQICAPYRPTRAALAVIGVAFLFSICANIVELSDSAQFWRSQSATIRAKLAAVKVAGDAAAPPVLVEEPPGAMTFNVETANQLDEDFGLPAYSEAELRTASPGDRRTADEELVRLLEIGPGAAGRVALFPAPGKVVVAAKSGGEVKRQGACVSLLPDLGATMEAFLQLPPGGMAYASAESPVVALGRFADAPAVSMPARSGSVAIRIPADASDVPWMARVRAGARTLVCPAAGLA
jgi:hypothetical protein